MKPKPVALYRAALAALRGPCALPRGTSVLVGCSGGPDSIALLHVLVELARRFGLSLAVAHLDHGVRGRSGAADARFVLRKAHALGLPVVAERMPPARYASEDAMRRVRRAFLRRVARESGAGAIALGHTADDQAETLLLRLARGAGVRGLGAMRPRTDDIVRPLLGATRAEVVEFLESRRLVSRRDPTNHDLRFARNFVRAEILPRFVHLNPGAVPTLAGIAGRMAAIADLVEAEAERAFEACKMRTIGGQIRLVGPRVLAYHPIVREAVWTIAYRAVAGPERRLTRRHLEALEELVSRGHGGASVSLPGPVVARLIRGTVLLAPRS